MKPFNAFWTKHAAEFADFFLNARRRRCAVSAADLRRLHFVRMHDAARV